MNIVLKDCILTSKDGNIFTKIKEVNIRGSALKYFRLSEEVLDKVQEEEAACIYFYIIYILYGISWSGKR